MFLSFKVSPLKLESWHFALFIYRSFSKVLSQKYVQYSIAYPLTNEEQTTCDHLIVWLPLISRFLFFKFIVAAGLQRRRGAIKLYNPPHTVSTKMSSLKLLFTFRRIKKLLEDSFHCQIIAFNVFHFKMYM